MELVALLFFLPPRVIAVDAGFNFTSRPDAKSSREKLALGIKRGPQDGAAR